MSPNRKVNNHDPDDHLTISRRGFVLGAAACAGSLIIGARMAPAEAQLLRTPFTDVRTLDAFIKIKSDSTVTVIIKHLDKGQGITTGLATIVADELDADPSQMRTEFAPADLDRYANAQLPFRVQGTGSSTSIVDSWDQMRKAAALARHFLVEAAAEKWGHASSASISIKKGNVTDQANNSVAFGGLVVLLEGQKTRIGAEFDPPLKASTDWVYITKSFPRIDSLAKTTGATRYAMDIRQPRMLTAVVARPPKFGSTVRSFNSKKAEKVSGVVAVIKIPQRPKGLRNIVSNLVGRIQDELLGIPEGIAVIAEDTWSAIKGREALSIEWNTKAAGVESRSTQQIFDDYRKELDRGGGIPKAQAGDATRALQNSKKVIKAEFTFPYLAQAPMEPLNAVLKWKKENGRYEAWAGSQFQTVDTLTMGLVLGAPSKVDLNTVWAGGSFGRRATPNADYLNELAHIVKALGGDRPVHLVWTREDDIKGGRYRPMVVHRVSAGLDDTGKPIAWEHRIVGQSFIGGTRLENFAVKSRLDVMAVEGATDLTYEIPNLSIYWHGVESAVPTLWWRSVGHTHTAHAIEVMIDELAWQAGGDRMKFREDLLTGKDRHKKVLKCAAEKGNLNETLEPGHGRGIALHESFGTIVAMVADVTVTSRGDLKVKRVVAAVDCGIAVNPDVIRAQIEGSIGFALGAALRNEITLVAGVVQQSNFHDYEPLRISDMPDVEVHIIKSDKPPTGIGEPGVPPVAPAISNAIRAATGKRICSLPLEPRLRAISPIQGIP